MPTTRTDRLEIRSSDDVVKVRQQVRTMAVAAGLATGATQGFIGLYQINFIVPQPPAGIEPCVDNASLVQGGVAVQSNLTVSVGSDFSFDGAGICVAQRRVTAGDLL